MKIKVCGMNFSENIQQVASLEPDYLGFIFYKNSPRNFNSNIPRVSSHIRKTGVFVNATKDFIVEKVSENGFAAVQLHGEESVNFCRDLRVALPEEAEIIKVFSIEEEFNFKVLKNYESTVDYFLFDTKGKNKGGNGITFNWEILKKYPSNIPFFLSGGIGLEEVPKIKELKKHLEKIGKAELFYGIDVNSRFETEPGLKDFEMVRKLRNSF